MAETITVVPGVYADIDGKGRLIGIEVVDASEFMGENLEFVFSDIKYALGRSA